MPIKALVVILSTVLPALLCPATQPAEEPQDIWKPFQFFVGQWEGTGEGRSGVSHGNQEYAFVLGGQFLHVRNKARFDPQEKNPKGERHEDWGFISFDRTRKVYVLRQFHVEGFVNQYISTGPAADGKTFVFLSEAIENLPPGFKAQLTYRILDENSFEQTFELAPPGQEMACYAKGIMKRKGARPSAPEARKKSLVSSPAFAVQVALDAASPFVPDGRHSLAEISFKVLFPSVTFEFDPDEDPLLGRCQVNAGPGKGAFSKLVLNEVQVGEERIVSSFLSARPREFGAGLAIEAEPTAEDEAAARSKTAPEKVELSFWTELGPTPVTFGSKFGSATLSDFKFVFEVPFRQLILGKPVSLTLPHQGRYPEDKGTWRIDIRPKSQAGGRS
jgi:hypothetical protein